RTPQAPAGTQAALETLPGESDGPLGPALATALDGRDRIDGAWSGEAQVAEWTTALRELLVAREAEQSTDDGPAVLYQDRRTREWMPVFDRGAITVTRRATAGGDLAAPTTRSRAHLRSELEAYSAGGAVRVALKIVAIESTPDGDLAQAWTDVRATAFQELSDERVERNSIWRVRWTRSPDGHSRLSEFHWLEEERARLASTRPAFVDRTTSAFAEALPEACERGLGDWRRRLDSLLGTGLLGHQGFAFADINGDGWEDLYLCQPGGLPNRVFLSRADGVLTDISATSGANFLDRSASALMLHLDADEHVDLAVATTIEILVLRGNGKGHFELQSRLPASTTTSLAAADFDLDGDLDIYACGYVSPYDDSATPLPYHDANNGQGNLLLRNDGDLGFIDVTAEAGLDQNNRRFSFAAAWADYDHDGDADLYVANDFGRNNLYRNTDGVFSDVAAELGVEDISAGMGVSWGDVDNDGWEDLFVSNMFSAAGGRIAGEQVFQPAADAQARDALQRHARGNTLFRNVDGQRFVDVTDGGGAGMGRWAWGSILFDVNSDGRLDVFVPNGMITGQRDDDL
ncbi:MAG: hypothetical protein ACI8QZ_000633, partial [Chlamydiales bacterium]